MVNEAPAGLKDVRSRLVLDTNPRMNGWKRSSHGAEETRFRSDKSTLNQRFLSTAWPKEPFKTRRRAVAIATALAVEGLALLRAGTRSGREVEEAAGYGDGWIGRGGRRAVTICVGRRRGVSSGWNQKRVDTAPVGRAGISIAQSNDNAREHAVAW